MFGETVVVRELGGTPVICKVWEVTAQKVYVCTEETFNKLKKHKDKPFPANCFPVAFPKEDVFRYNSKQKGQLTNWRNTPDFWKQLTRYA